MQVEPLLKQTPLYPHWKRVGIQHHHGVNVALASLRSHRSEGIGSFSDLISLIHWCKEVGFDVIQLLPLNDSGFDSSPYNALSSTALNPIYLSLSELPGFQEPLESLLLLNATSHVHYEEVRKKKMELLWSYFKKLPLEKIHPSSIFEFAHQHPWLEGYALFCILKRLYQGKSWTDWPDEVRTPSPKTLSHLKALHQEELLFFIWLQYLCYQQLSAVREEAEKHHILLMGDIPVLPSLDSADVWLSRELFDTDSAAGTPPDEFNLKGQYWGFPTYRVEELQNTGYLYWQHRLTYASSFYHLYRIDHVIGLFRQWTIPRGRPPEEGAYFPSYLEEALAQGEALLRFFIRFSPLLPLAEDLGAVPDQVKELLHQLGIPGVRVMRWEDPPYYPINLTTVSTHDLETLAEWWVAYPEEAASCALSKEWDYPTPWTTDHQRSLLHSSHHTSTLFHVNPLQEYLTLFPELSWKDPRLERINRPGFILPTNWTYRYRPYLEEITSHSQLKEEIRNLL